MWIGMVWSMREEDKLIEKAENTLEDAEKAFDVDMMVSTVQNRIYYSVFYAAQAGLVSRGIDAGSHQGVKIKIGEELIKNDLLDKKWGRFFSQQQTYREQADYQVDVDIEKSDLKSYLDEAHRFIKEMKEIVSD
jgi:uncharacterized protein (UPF0332 family)